MTVNAGMISRFKYLRWTLCFILCMQFIFAVGCTSNANSSTIKSKEIVSAEPSTLLSTDFSLETYPVEKSYFAAQELVFSALSQDLSVYVIAMTACGDGIAVLGRSLTDGVDCLYFFDESGTQTNSFRCADKLQKDSVNVSYIAGTSSGVTVYLSVFDAALQQVTNEVCVFDNSGNLIRNPSPISFKDASFSPTGMTVLQSGEITFGGFSSAGNVFYVYDASMKLMFEISGDNLSGKILESNGAVYVDGQISINGKTKYCFYPVDMETGKLASAIDVSEIAGQGVTASNSGKLYSNDTSGLYAIDLSGNKMKTLVDWKEINIDQSVYSFLSPVCILSENVMFILGTDRSEGDEKGKIVMLTRQENNPNIGKQTLILGGFEIASNPTLLTTIDSFNQSNGKYRIEIKDYLKDIDWSQSTDKINQDMEKCVQQMYLDVFSGKGPDIFYNGDYSNTINSFADYEANNSLIDMYPLMKSDPNFKIEDYLPNVVDACTVDGKICKIPIHFSINSIDANHSLTGGISGWTTDEFDKMAASLPSGMQMITNLTKLELLKYSLTGSMDFFVDQTTQKLSFNTEEFYKLLKWAKTYGIEEPKSAEERVYVDESQQFMSGLLACTTMNNIDSTFGFSVVLPQNFGTDLDLIGYPSPEKNGPYILPSEIVAISSWCKNPEGAWAFVKFLLSDDYQTNYSTDYKAAYNIQGTAAYGFPIKSNCLQEMIALAMDPPPLSGDGIDPNAKPIILTQAQADACLKAINDTNTLYYPDQQIMTIIEEEVQAYFTNQRTVEDVASLIQNRVQTLIYERK